MPCSLSCGPRRAEWPPADLFAILHHARRTASRLARGSLPVEQAALPTPDSEQARLPALRAEGAGGVRGGVRRGTRMSEQRNVLGGPLATCGSRPMTGFYRTGCCETSSEDRGSHTVCALLTAEFLSFSQEVGND